MRVFILILLFVLIFTQKRLIKFSENDKGVYLTHEEIDNLTNIKSDGKEINFMDITETKDLEKGEIPKLSPVVTELRQVDFVKSMFKYISETNLNNTIIKLSSYFNRYYTTPTGEESAQWLFKQYEDIIASSPIKEKLSVQYFKHTWRQPSIIARIEGNSNSPVKDEIVVIGGHIDSIAGGPNNRSPGADDDASGSATVLETFRILASNPNFKPDRSVEFHGYAAEEVGLLGSQAVAQKYKNDQKKVHAMLQNDMTGFNPASNQNRVGVVTDFTNAEISTILRRCIQTYGELPFSDTRCGYACSDHGSWTRAGYRSSFGFEVGQFNMLNRAIHTQNDLITLLDMKRNTKFVKYSIGFAVELSKN